MAQFITKDSQQSFWKQAVGNMDWKRTVSLLSILLLMAAVPVTVFISQQKQVYKQHAETPLTWTGARGYIYNEDANGNCTGAYTGPDPAITYENKSRYIGLKSADYFPSRPMFYNGLPSYDLEVVENDTYTIYINPPAGYIAGSCGNTASNNSHNRVFIHGGLFFQDDHETLAEDGFWLKRITGGYSISGYILNTDSGGGCGTLADKGWNPEPEQVTA